MLQFIIMLALAALPIDHQSDDYLLKAARLHGADCLEELSESELERYQQMASHPLDLNSATRAQLLSTGFFTPYQVASLMDAIRTSGDILSITELAAVPGIGLQMARDLEPFIILSPHGTLGASNKGSLYVDAGMRQSYRNGNWTSALKSSATLDSRYSAAIAVKDDEFTSASLSYSGRAVSKAVAGSYSARFGQGLLMWSGFSLSGLSTVSAFSRNATGISASSTLSCGSCFTGAAATMNLGRASLSLAADIGGVQIANANFLWSRTSAGVTAVRDPNGYRTSADFRTTVGKFTLLGEGALDFANGGTAALLGSVWNISYGRKAAMLLRAYSPSYGGTWSGAPRSSTRVSDEYAASLGLSLPWLSATADAAWHPSKQTSQYKGVMTLQRQFGWLTPSLRITSRWKPEAAREVWRNDMRMDLDASWEGLQGHFRFNAVNCEGWSWLWYLEAGVKKEASLYLRFTLFKVDQWADRIYVYERDVPGSFNVPSYYGRGWSLSLYAGWKDIKLRMATTQYPWSGKDPGYELKLLIGMKSQNLKPRLRPSAD